MSFLHGCTCGADWCDRCANAWAMTNSVIRRATVPGSSLPSQESPMHVASLDPSQRYRCQFHDDINHDIARIRLDWITNHLLLCHDCALKVTKGIVETVDTHRDFDRRAPETITKDDIGDLPKSLLDDGF